MGDVNETLQQLLERRLREMGKERGRDEPLSLLEAFQAIKDPGVTYELVRRVQKDGHRNIGRKAVRTIATMLGVPPEDVSRAAHQLPARGPFVLPERADKLDDDARAVVLSVIDAIIKAAESSPASKGKEAGGGSGLTPVRSVRSAVTRRGSSDTRGRTPSAPSRPRPRG